MEAQERVTLPSPGVTEALGPSGPQLGPFLTPRLWRRCRRVQVLQSRAETIHWTRNGAGWSPALKTPPPVVRWGLWGEVQNLWRVRDSCACVCCQLSRVWLFVTPWTVPRQAPLSMEFPRQECWCGVPFPTWGDLPDPGIKPLSLVSLHWPTDSLPLCYGTPQEVSTPSEFREREAIARNSWRVHSPLGSFACCLVLSHKVQPSVWVEILTS